jgi:hypothetical protein
MMCRLRILASLFFLFFLPHLAVADCFFNGQSYSEGTVIDGHVCQGGQWVKI